MGMLFNTATTLELIAKVNAAFNNQGLIRLRHDQAAVGGIGWATTFAALPNVGPSVGTYESVLKDFPIDLDNGKGVRSKNWQSWLNAMDNSTMNNPDPGSGGALINVASYIGIKISTAINDYTYHQIEFFAVPTPPPASAPRNVSASARDITSNGEKSMIIQINTTTLDCLK